MPDTPLVSVIIPAFNRPELIKRAVTSALSQSYQNLEVVVADDHSDADIQSELAPLGDSRIIVSRHEENRGASAARNTAIAMASGEYLAFLDDDDEWSSTKIEKQVALMQASSEDVGLIYCWTEYQIPDGTVIAHRRPELRGNVFDQMLGAQVLVNSSGLLVRSLAAEEIGPWDEVHLRGNDGDFIRRLCRNWKVDFVPEVLASIHVNHGPQISEATRKGITEEVAAINRKLEKFAVDFKSHPEAHNATLRSLGVSHARLGQRVKAFGYLLKAIKVKPWSKANLRSAIRIVIVRRVR